MGTASAPDGIRIQFDSEGAGERSLIFVHGWSCDRSYWKAQVPAFAARYGGPWLGAPGHHHGP